MIFDASFETEKEINMDFDESDQELDMDPIDERTDLFPVRSVDGVVADPAGNIDLSETRNAEIARQLKAMQESGVFDGESVTVSNVSESTEDGGSNIVTFSDGKTLIVKNGSKGGKGDKGDPGDTPVREVDYWTEEDKTEIVNEVLEQAPQGVMIVNITSTTTDGVTTYTSNKTAREIVEAIWGGKYVVAEYQKNVFNRSTYGYNVNVGLYTVHFVNNLNRFVLNGRPDDSNNTISYNDNSVWGPAKGGTGLAELTAGSYLVGNGKSKIVLKTPEEVLKDIGAQPAGDYITADDIPQEAMIVNITGTTTDGKTTYTADKTALDVYNAYNEGKLVFARDGDSVYPLVAFPQTGTTIGARFVGLLAANNSCTYVIITNSSTNKNLQVVRSTFTVASTDSATQSKDGLMAAADKVKLDGIDESKFVPVLKQNNNAYVELSPDVSNDLAPFLNFTAAVNNEMSSLVLGRSLACLFAESFDGGRSFLDMAPDFFSVETVDPDNCGSLLAMDGDSFVYNADEGVSGNVVMGCGCEAAGENNVAFGRETLAEGFGAAVFGANNTSSELSLSAGQGNAAFDTSVAVGYSNWAGGGASAAFGMGNSADAFASFASGYQNAAINFGAAVFGKCNNFTEGGASVAVSEGDAFIVGNGVGTDMEERSNAFRVTYGGEVFGKAAYNASGADYAEFFEWLDGNPETEDRIGRFVTMDGAKIKIADRGDYILGIVSGNPCLVGNSDEEWQGRWERDEYNRFIQEEFDAPVTERKIVEELVLDEEGNKIPLIRTGRKRVEIPVLDENGELTGQTKTEFQKVNVPVLDEDGNQKYRTKRKVVFEETGDTVKAKRFKQNPAYDGKRGYTARRLRKEWDYIGMLGVLSVCDDGTCEVNGFCEVAAGGIATAAEKYIPGMTYRVIERVSENIVKVVFK